MGNQAQEPPQMHPDREQLFGNEAFAIGMLQVVSGGSIVAAVSQLDVFIRYADKLFFLVFISLMSGSLLAAVLAAYWRHQYKMWDIKQNSSKANWYLAAMRRSMLVAVLFVVVGVISLVAAFWYSEFSA